MKIVSAASAFPRHYYKQEALLSTLQQYWGDRLENPQLLSRLFSHARVDGRYLALPMIKYYGLDTWGAANLVRGSKRQRIWAPCRCAGRSRGRVLTPLAWAR